MSTTRRRHPGTPGLTAAARLALAVVAVSALLAGCASGQPDDAPADAGPGGSTQSSAPEATPTPEPTPPTPSDPATDTATTLVSFPVDTRTGFRLAREPRAVPAADPLVGAVEAMLAGPVDGDYTAVWNPATRVRSVTVADGVATVDLSAEARTANVGSALAALMVDQLVQTVTDAAGDPSLAVLLTVDGAPAGDLWGAVTWDEPTARSDPLDVRLLVGIDDIAEGASVTSPVVVSGEACVFEATLPWQVLAADGGVVASGFTMTAEGQTFAPYSFEVTLAPGTYTVVVMEDDPSDGAGGPVMTDSRTIVVG